jgi:hypothetical protein
MGLFHDTLTCVVICRLRYVDMIMNNAQRGTEATDWHASVVRTISYSKEYRDFFYSRGSIIVIIFLVSLGIR